MDPSRFDQMLRQLATGSRRQALQTLAASALAAVATRLGIRAAGAITCYGQCPNCLPNACFLDPLTNKCICCPNFCQHPTTFELDQCCYADEVCNPAKASEANSFSICCRKCRRKCCDADQRCRKRRCRAIKTARAVRRRS